MDKIMILNTPEDSGILNWCLWHDKRLTYTLYKETNNAVKECEEYMTFLFKNIHAKGAYWYEDFGTYWYYDDVVRKSYLIMYIEI